MIVGAGPDALRQAVADRDRTIADLRGEVSMLRTALAAQVADHDAAAIESLIAPLRTLLDPPGTYSTTGSLDGRPRTPADAVAEVVRRSADDAKQIRELTLTAYHNRREIEAAHTLIGRLTMELAAVGDRRD